jgi:PHS family inorganic phosphate transporter-like MFS transporter
MERQRNGRLPRADASLSGQGRSVLAELDKADVPRRQWLTVLTAGMGFFTDAYDLFVIGTVSVIVERQWHLGTGELSLLNSASLLASVVGALVFGRVMDRFGRKRMYGLEVALLTAGALASAFAWSFPALLAFRLVVGLGVGGDYATSAVITAEYANRSDRGRLVGVVFAMQSLGLLAGPAVIAVLLGGGVSADVAWRVMLGLGAVPAASVIWLRRRIGETPRYSLDCCGDVQAARRAVAWALGDEDAPRSGPRKRKAAAPSGASGRPRLLQAPYRRRLLAAAGCWFLLDVVFYGNSISSPLILAALQPKGTLLDHTIVSGAIFLVAALPGYWLAVALLDRSGRRRIQWRTFVGMAVAFGLLALVPGAETTVPLFLVLFAASYFFVEFGPNMTTFVYPAELFPTAIRGSGDGIAAAAGKLGAFVGALVVPELLAAAGLRGVMAVLALSGAALTVALLPETSRRSLEALVDAEGLPGPAVLPEPSRPLQAAAE